MSFWISFSRAQPARSQILNWFRVTLKSCSLIWGMGRSLTTSFDQLMDNKTLGTCVTPCQTCGFRCKVIQRYLNRCAADVGALLYNGQSGAPRLRETPRWPFVNAIRWAIVVAVAAAMAAARPSPWQWPWPWPLPSHGCRHMPPNPSPPQLG